MADLRDGDVVTYRIEGSAWCRHGIAVYYWNDGGPYAKDTYWGIGERSDSGYTSIEQLLDPHVIGNIYEFEHKRYVYDPEDYAEEDRFYIPMGGHSGEVWIRVGAEKKHDLIEKRLKYELEKAWGKIKSAASNFGYAVQQYMEHVDKRSDGADKPETSS